MGSNPSNATKFITIERHKMSAWLIAAVGFVYLYIAIEQGIKGNYAMCATYVGYAFANVGLYMLATK